MGKRRYSYYAGETDARESEMEISIRQEQDFVSVKLAGAINEDNDLAEHLDRIAGSVVVVDLSDVERINSCGVRDWVNWIHALEAKGAEMFFLECSPSIVAQINLVNNFTGHGRIKSLYLPYYCESCNQEHSVLYEAEDLATPEPLPPASRCSGCEKFMDFDDMPDAYFAFLADHDRLLLGDAPTDSQRFAVPKKSIRASAPVFAHGSTSLPDIDQMLETKTSREAGPVEEALTAAETTEAKIAATTTRGDLRVAYASIAMLIAGAATLIYVLT